MSEKEIEELMALGEAQLAQEAASRKMPQAALRKMPQKELEDLMALGEAQLKNPDMELTITAPRDPNAPVRPTPLESIPLYKRFIAQLTSDPVARENFLKREFGPENVTQQDGRFIIKTPEGAKTLDPSGWDLGDLVDIPGEVLEAAGGVAGGVLGAAASVPTTGGAASPAITALGEATGAGTARALAEGLFQGLSGVQSNMGKEAITSAALTAVLSGGLKGVQHVGREVLKLMPGYAIKHAEQAVSRLDDTVTGAVAGLKEFGDDTAEAMAFAGAKVKRAVEAVLAPSVRARQAAGVQINKTIRALPGRTRVDVPNTIKTLNKWADDLGGSAMGESSKKAAAYARYQAQELAGEDAASLLLDVFGHPATVETLGGLSPQSMAKTLKSLNSAARGQETVIKGLKAKDPLQKKIAGSLFEAMLKDFDEAANAGLLSPVALREHLASRAAYKAAVEAEKAVGTRLVKTALKIADGSPEAAVRAIRQATTTPRQVKALALAMQSADQEGLDALKYMYIQDSINRASKGADVDPLAAIRAINQDRAKRDALFFGDEMALGQFKTIEGSIERLKSVRKYDEAVLANLVKKALNIAGADALAETLANPKGRNFVLRSIASILNPRTAAAPAAAVQAVAQPIRPGMSY